MSKKIIVAGAGHGGLVAAAYLAEQSYDVEVFEKLKREELGYDWHDTIGRDTFDIAGITEYDRSRMTPRRDSTFYAPSMATPVSFDIDPARAALEIDRKDMYDYLIDNAESKGVKINYSQCVEGPLLDKNNDVCGLIVDGKEVSADLVIDSAGMFSPVITGLPEKYQMTDKYCENDVFHTYRAYYNLVDGVKTKHMERFNIYFRFNGIKGIAWFKIADGMADFLIGSVQPLSEEKVQEVLSKMRKVQPGIGDKLLRGGQIVDIPIKSTHTLLVGNNYAAVGDVVSMPDPMNGSGITTAVKAGAMLAETIIEIDKAGKGFTAAELWHYQVKYYKAIANKAIATSVLKNCLLSYSERALNFFFDKEILTANELGGSGGAMKMDKAETIAKLKRGLRRPISLLKLKKAVDTSKEARRTALAIPEGYNAVLVEDWRRQMDRFIRQ
jgi:flavin-dependent dehydrogenase